MSTVLQSIERDATVSIEEFRKELRKLARFVPNFDPMRPMQGRDPRDKLFETTNKLDSRYHTKLTHFIIKAAGQARLLGISESTWRKIRNSGKGITTATFATMVSSMAAALASERGDTDSIMAHKDRRTIAMLLIGIDDDHGRPIRVAIESPALKRLYYLARDLDEESIETIVTIAKWRVESRS